MNLIRGYRYWQRHQIIIKRLLSNNKVMLTDYCKPFLLIKANSFCIRHVCVQPEKVGPYFIGKIKHALYQCIPSSAAMIIGQYIKLLQLHLRNGINLLVERVPFHFGKTNGNIFYEGKKENIVFLPNAFGDLINIISVIKIFLQPLFIVKQMSESIPK